MEITKNIIEDLLPLYITGECSEDTKKAVEAYTVEHPEIAETIAAMTADPLQVKTAVPLNPSDEMRTINRTKFLLKRRSYLLGFAIFFTLVPFSFLYSNGEFHWLMLNSPVSAITYEFLAAFFWIAYWQTKRKL